MNDFWGYTFWGNTIRDWAIALSIIVGACILLRIFKSVVTTRLKKFSERSKTSLDDFLVLVLDRSIMPLAYIVAIYYGIQYLTLGTQTAKIMHTAIMVVSAFFIIRIVNSFISYLFSNALSKGGDEVSRRKQASGILLIIKLVVWMLGILFLVDNLGYDITTIVAGLGIGGIAIALAAQTILGDLFSYIVIFFDKPFEVGDFIIIDDKMGTVEYVGIKTTRIRTLGGEQLICSNTDLTNSRVHNYKRMDQRRIVFEFGIIYDTPFAKLEKIPSMVKSIVESTELTRFDRAHFRSFGDSALEFEVVYYVLSSDYNIYMDIQQAINFKLFENFKSNEIEFAFPTQTIHIDKANNSLTVQVNREQSLTND